MPRRETEIHVIGGLFAGATVGSFVGGPVGAIVCGFFGGLVAMGLDGRDTAPPERRYH